MVLSLRCRTRVYGSHWGRRTSSTTIPQRNENAAKNARLDGNLAWHLFPQPRIVELWTIWDAVRACGDVNPIYCFGPGSYCGDVHKTSMVQLPVPNKAVLRNHQHISRMGEGIMAKGKHRIKGLLSELVIISFVVVTSTLLVAHMVINVLKTLE